MPTIGVTITNTNPVRVMAPRATVRLQKSIDGLSYSIVTATGALVSAGIPLWFVDGFLVAMPEPMPLIDRPKGATAK